VLRSHPLVDVDQFPGVAPELGEVAETLRAAWLPADVAAGAARSGR
jgi:hypothetical protein